MKMTAILAAGLAAAMALPGALAAATFSGEWAVSYNAADPGLVVEAAPGGGFGATDLEVGQSYGFKLFHIWTNETTVNAGEDEDPYPIEVSFDFYNPAASGVVSGVTKGERSAYGAVQNGRLTWDSPLVLNFGEGDTGQFTIMLSDAVFNKGLFGLHEGYKYGADVHATLRYDAAPSPAPVPLPAALPLLAAGFGVMGVAARRRRAAV